MNKCKAKQRHSKRSGKKKNALKLPLKIHRLTAMLQKTSLLFVFFFFAENYFSNIEKYTIICICLRLKSAFLRVYNESTYLRAPLVLFDLFLLFSCT